MPIGWSYHPHVLAKQPKFEEPHGVRLAAEAGLVRVVKDVGVSDDTEIVDVLRTKDMPTR